MAETPNGLRKQVETQKSRLDGLVGQLNTQLNDISKQIGLANEVINALTKIIGDEEVRTVLETTRKEARLTKELEEAAQLKLLADNGILKLLDTVTDTSTVVVRETHPNGDVVRRQFHMSEVQGAETKTQLVGKKPGESFEIQGVKIEIQEAYLYDEVRAKQVMDERQKKVQEAEQAANLAQQATKAAAPPVQPPPPTTDEAEQTASEASAKEAQDEEV